MYQYWAFGLYINSDLAFPEFLPASFDKADLHIHIGKTPAELKGKDVVHKVKMSASPSEYLLEVSDIARYYVCNGNTIITEPLEGADEKSVRLFLLSNAMAAILHQQNKIPFHASGIIAGNELILFTGNSGAGKSTTAYGLMQEGYQLFTDDVCVLQLNRDNNIITAVPSYPMMKLWENTVDQFEGADLEKKHRLRPHIPKYGFFQHDNFLRNPFPVSRIYVLKTSSTIHQFSCTKLNKLEAFNVLQQNTYRRKHVEIMQLRQPHFEIISRLANQAAVAEISRPATQQPISSFISFVKEQL